MTTVDRIKDQERINHYRVGSGKLGLHHFRQKFTFNISKGLSGHEISEFLKGEKEVNFDVYLPSKKKNLQRGFVWTMLQKQELIYSVLKGVKIPPLAAILFEHKLFKIIDGKQRLSTLMEFCDNKFSIQNEGVDYYFKDLTNEAKHEIDQCLTFDIAYEYGDRLISDDQKIAWFEMINFAGTPQDAEHLKYLKS